MSLARLFPAAYLLLWFPAALLGDTRLRLAVALAAFFFAALGDRAKLRQYGLSACLALLSYILLLGVVNAAACSALGAPLNLTLSGCIMARAVPSIGLILAILSIVLLAIANEWRGTLIRTVNALALPRDVKVVLAIAGSLVGEFRRASVRVHHAATARGAASPQRSFRNWAALPQLAAATWASVLSIVNQRLEHQWAAEAFWDRYFPVSSPELRQRSRSASLDFLVLIGGIAALGWAIWAIFSDKL